MDSEDLKRLKHLSDRHHMAIPWGEFAASEGNELAINANLREKSAIIGRVGLIMLSCGTGAWRVRESMNTFSRVMGVTCSADIGLVSLEYTCYDGDLSYTQALSLPTTGVNTDKLREMESFIRRFANDGAYLTVNQTHHLLDEIEHKKGNYAPVIVGLAAALACSGFVFLLGGGIVEMICCFIGAGFGNFVRRKMGDKHITHLANVAVSVAVACLVYLLAFEFMLHFVDVDTRHEAGYIGSMLFVIPGFPFITSGLDIAKLDMRSGLERLAHAVTVVVVATLVGWVVAMCVHLHPADFIPLHLAPMALLLLRIPASFCGVYGFSTMFNSTPRMAATAGCIGAIANTLRLELVDLGHIPPSAAAFLGALVAGLLASLIHHRMDFPRISLTVPSIVIMVPGLYLYRAVYNIGLTSIGVGSYWLTQAILIIVALPCGLITARILTDPKWRYSD